jgi:hypothetical protein
MQTTIENIDPTTAKEMLALNLNNRNPKTGRIAQYAADMTAGRWRLNGESLKFGPAENGERKLLDGQNRLHAIIESGVTIQTVIAWDVDPGHQSTVDTGAARSYADVLRMRGIKNSVAVAAVVRAVTVWEVSRSFDPKGVLTPSMQALDETLTEHPEILEYASHLSTIAKQVHLPLASLGALWWVFFNIDAQDCEFFWDRLRSDEDHVNGEPIFALRRFLRNTAEQRGMRPHPKYLSAVSIKSWNAYRDGTTIKTLGYRPGGANPEKFPEAH